ncbi:MAG TPA: alpha-1,2-fucosyltransferase [Stellaceae bacterium]|nr:alpha-1,2-fucosyltransferase [Stellaceae bacterium]
MPIAELTKLYYAGAWTEAERLCEAILSQQPQHAEVLLIWAEAALARGDARAARERLRRTIRAPLPNCDAVLRALRLLDRAGDHEALESATRYWGAQLRREPAHYALLYALGLASGFLGRIDEAVRAFEAACALVPSNGGPDTYRSILLLRRAWGAPRPSPPEKRQPAITCGRTSMEMLGRMGRFGNQLFQYGFLRLYGYVHGLRVEVPDWIGRWVFDLDDPYPEMPPLRPFDEKLGKMGGFLRPGALPSLANHDLRGYLQCHTSHFRPYQAMFRDLFRPGSRLEPIVSRAIERLRGLGRTIVAVHLRRGDYTGGELFWPAPASWYLDWLRAIWPSLDAPVLYVASDDPSIHREFSEFAPITAAAGESILGAEMFPDFHILACADLLAISNSSFSVSAAMLNERGRAYVRPDPHLRRLVSFDPWSTDVLLSASQPAAPPS